MKQKVNVYRHALKILSSAIEIHPKDTQNIKTIGDMDNYRYANPVNGQILSRYKTMVNLYGIDNADRIMRGLEVRSW